MDVKVSVVVPVYNAQQDIARCIRSILRQDLKELEVIVIDDGSSDGSGEICDRLALEDGRIKVVHRENQGVSCARNYGISIAQGEYIGFVDSDDQASPKMFSCLYNRAEEQNADMVICDAVTKDGESETLDTFDFLDSGGAFTKDQITPEMLILLAGAAWRCLYRRSLLSAQHICFPEGLKFSEDRVFNILALGNSRVIYYEKTALYSRFLREGSAVSRYYSNYLEIALDAREATFNALETTFPEMAYRNKYEKHTLGFALSAVYNEFHPDCAKHLCSRYRTIQAIAGNSTVQQAITLLKPTDIRSKLLEHQRCVLLMLVAVLYNIKRGK